MAILRDRPYVQFNFLVDLGTGNTDGPEAGFQELSNIGMEVTVSEYRTGNSKENSVRKITGLNKATDVTLKRGVIGLTQSLPVAERHSQRQPDGRAHGDDPTAKRRSHSSGADVEASTRAHHQAYQRTLQRQGHRCGDGRVDARLRTSGEGIAESDKLQFVVVWSLQSRGPVATNSSLSDT